MTRPARSPIRRAVLKPLSVVPLPGSERVLTLPEVQEMHACLTQTGFVLAETTHRVGNDTIMAVRDFQKLAWIEPASGYGGLKVLVQLREEHRRQADTCWTAGVHSERQWRNHPHILRREGKCAGLFAERVMCGRDRAERH